MRIAVGLLACLAAGAVTTVLADPSTEAAPAPAAQAAPAAHAAPAAAAATPAAPAAPVAKPAIDKDAEHFMAEGYKPEMRRGQQVYCKTETELGSRVNRVKTCGTLEQLKLNENEARSNVSDMQRAQVGTSSH